MSGTKNKIQDLRDHLFETLEQLKDPDKPMEIERAKAIANVAQAIIHSAKVEVDFLKATGASALDSDFISEGERRPVAKQIGAARRARGPPHRHQPTQAEEGGCRVTITILAAKTREALEHQLGELVAGDVTVHALAYAIGPKGEREAIVLYGDGRAVQIPAHVRAWLSEQIA